MGTEFLAALQPHRAGVYVNFLDSDDDTSRVHEAYGDDAYLRLAEVKAKYDPENVFHNNKNVQPTFHPDDLVYTNSPHVYTTTVWRSTSWISMTMR